MADESEPRRLIVVGEDHADSAELLVQRLERAGYRAVIAPDGETVLSCLEQERPDLLILDVVMPGMGGLEALRRLRAQAEHADLPVILLTGRAAVADRVAGLETGADEYLTKPIEEAELLARVRAMLRLRDAIADRDQAVRESRRLRDEVEALSGLGQMVGNTPAMQRVYWLVQKVTDVPAAVLVTGESGVGKELVARAIHRHGARADGPFIPVHCGALPESLLEAELFGHRRGSFTGAVEDRAGVFEAAHEGTIFLDEIGDISPATQARLLRVLQEGEVTRVGESQPRKIDARVISATNKDLREEIRAGRFREDLFYRLHTIEIPIPPLRERREDILRLAAHFVSRCAETFGRPTPGLSEACKAVLLDHDWPGNVRELQNEMERAVTLVDPGKPIEADLLSEDVREGEDAGHLADDDGSLRQQVDQHERQLIVRALERNYWNQTQTAAELGLSRQGFAKKLKRYGLSRPDSM
jgi:DNA-binding NtrC family response regulator